MNRLSMIFFIWSIQLTCGPIRVDKLTCAAAFISLLPTTNCSYAHRRPSVSTQHPENQYEAQTQIKVSYVIIPLLGE
jgi:hypothetical protein